MAGNFPPLTPRVGLRQNPAHDPYPFRQGPGRIQGASTLSLQTTASTSYVDLATVGPTLTVATNGPVIVTVSCQLDNSVAGSFAIMSFAVDDVTGTEIVSPSDDYALVQQSSTAGSQIAASFTVVTTPTPGVLTFTAKYRVHTSGTGSFNNRRITVQI